MMREDEIMMSDAPIYLWSLDGQPLGHLPASGVVIEEGVDDPNFDEVVWPPVGAPLWQKTRTVVHVDWAEVSPEAQAPFFRTSPLPAGHSLLFEVEETYDCPDWPMPLGLRDLFSRGYWSRVRQVYRQRREWDYDGGRRKRSYYFPEVEVQVH